MSYREQMSDFLTKYPYQTMKAEGGSFRYVLAGDDAAPCIVFLNGGMNCSEMWFQYVESMSEEYRVLIFDYPMELSDCGETAAAMHSFFNKLSIKKAFFAGASFGGLMAQIFARQYPEMVSGLGLFSTAGLDENTIRASRKKYRFLQLMLWYMKRCNYEKLKPKLISGSMKYTKQETPDDQRYIREMFEYMFADYTREKDLHITGMMARLVDMEPCTSSDFEFVKDRVLLIFPEKDFFSKDEQESLQKLFPQAKTEYIQNGHFGTVLEYEKYIGWMKAVISEE